MTSKLISTTVAVAAAGLVMLAQFGFGLSQMGPPDPMKCFSAFNNAAGCVSAVNETLSENKASSNLGPACCKVATGLADGCWSLLFPGYPSFPFVTILKGFCGLLKNKAAP